MICAAGVDFFLQLDLDLLKFGNIIVANSVFDAVMPVITNLAYWRIPVILALAVLALFGGRYGLVSVVLGVILIAITDQLSSTLLKDLVGRVRPCHVVPDLRVLAGCGNSKSFPSSHAANTMAAALFFGFRYRKMLPWLLGLSILVSYSRVYIGIHYPSDLAGGWLIGALCAAVVLLIHHRVQRRWPNIEHTRSWPWVKKLLHRPEDAKRQPEG